MSAWLPGGEAEAQKKSGTAVHPAPLAAADQGWSASGTVLPVGCLRPN